jgi:hypothetical protein
MLKPKETPLELRNQHRLVSKACKTCICEAYLCFHCDIRITVTTVSSLAAKQALAAK